MKGKSDYLYRIIKFEHLYDLLKTKEIFVARPENWEDPYEMRLQHPATRDLFAQCWCRRGVSDAMWRIYSPDKSCVRIKVRRKRLTEQLENAQKQFPFRRKVINVKYKSQQQIDDLHQRLADELNANYSPTKAFDALIYKRRAFDHEVETRVLIYAENVSKDEPGIRIPVNPNELIETVLADPRMPGAMYRAFRYYIKDKLRYSGGFNKSGIYSQRESLRAGFDEPES